MPKKSSAAKPAAQQVFRQFAWNIAGTLASGKPARSGGGAAVSRKSGAAK